MSYESIPPERQREYLENAMAVFEESVAPIVDPAVEALGVMVAGGAVVLAVNDAQGPAMADAVENFVAVTETPLGDEAAEYLKEWDEYIKHQTHGSYGRGRVDLGGMSFGTAKPVTLDKLIGRMTLPNAVWAIMRVQNRPGN